MWDLSKALFFDYSMRHELDITAELFFETYVSTHNHYESVKIHIPKNDIDIYCDEFQSLQDYIRYGLNLVDLGLHPGMLDFLLQNAYEVFLDNCSSVEKNITRVKLLYVRKCVLYLQKGDIDSYIEVTKGIVTGKADMEKIYAYFNKNFKIKERTPDVWIPIK